jgi:hypothetical protein
MILNDRRAEFDYRTMSEIVHDIAIRRRQREIEQEERDKEFHRKHNRPYVPIK